jgi:hypothetical protein
MATLQFSVALRNSRADRLQAIAGTTAVMNIYTGSLPANCAAATTGTLLASIALPAAFMAAASGGAAAMTGTWQDNSADNGGTAAYARIFTDSGATTCVLQGDVGTSGAAVNLDNIVFAAGQNFSITAFTLTEANT